MNRFRFDLRSKKSFFVGALLCICACECEGRSVATRKPQGLSIAQWGERLFKQQQCATCHSLDGRVCAGGPLNDLAGTERTLTDGRLVTFDADYIRESIRDPMAKVVKGKLPQMPAIYAACLNDAQLEALVAFILSANTKKVRH